MRAVHAASGSSADPAGAFTVVVIPDTQFLSNSATWIDHFQAAADWIVANRTARNIQLVLHVGDVVHNPNTTTEFDRADGPMSTIWDSGVPFLAAIGNHDYDAAGATGAVSDHDDTTRWNAYFGTDRYTAQSWWDGGFMTSGRSENMYARVNLGGIPTLVMVLEFFPRAATLAWADGVIEDHPDHQVIVLTHAYMYVDGTRTEDGDAAGPNSYAIADASSGETMWQDHFRNHPNVVQVYSGHHNNGDPTADRTDYTDDGTLTYQQFTNWQGEDEGGDGRIVLMQATASHMWGRREVYNARTATLETAHEQAFPWTSYLDLALLDSRFVASVTEADVRDAGRWEVVVSGSPAAATTTPDGTDWVYGWVSG